MKEKKNAVTLTIIWVPQQFDAQRTYILSQSVCYPVILYLETLNLEGRLTVTLHVDLV